jgi:hypothetical protein
VKLIQEYRGAWQPSISGEVTVGQGGVQAIFESRLAIGNRQLL